MRAVAGEAEDPGQQQRIPWRAGDGGSGIRAESIPLSPAQADRQLVVPVRERIDVDVGVEVPHGGKEPEQDQRFHDDHAKQHDRSACDGSWNRTSPDRPSAAGAEPCPPGHRPRRVHSRVAGGTKVKAEVPPPRSCPFRPPQWPSRSPSPDAHPGLLARPEGKYSSATALLVLGAGAPLIAATKEARCSEERVQRRERSAYGSARQRPSPSDSPRSPRRRGRPYCHPRSLAHGREGADDRGQGANSTSRTG